MEDAKDGYLSKVHFVHFTIAENRMWCKNFLYYSERERVEMDGQKSGCAEQIIEEWWPEDLFHSSLFGERW